MPCFKDYPADYSQSQFFPGNVFDLLPDDHDCFVYRDLFEQLDTSEVDGLYSGPGPARGRAAADRVDTDNRVRPHGCSVCARSSGAATRVWGSWDIAGKRCSNFPVLSDFRKDARIMGKKGDVRLRLQRADRDGRGRADHRQPGAERPAGYRPPWKPEKKDSAAVVTTKVLFHQYWPFLEHESAQTVALAVLFPRFCP